MLSMKVFESAETDWASPIVSVPNLNVTLLCCTDHRKLNVVTSRDSFSLRRMDDCLNSLGDANIFSILDENSGYWQFKEHKSNREKTAFTTHNGMYQFIIMPLKLRNASAAFQHFTDIILFTVKW